MRSSLRGRIYDGICPYTCSSSRVSLDVVGGSIYVANYRKQESSVSQAIDFLRADFRIRLRKGNFATEPLVTQRGRAKCLQHRHLPRAQPIAPMWERHCRRPRLTPEVLHRAGPLSRAGTPQWRTQEEKRPKRLTIQCDAMPTRLPSFRLLAMASSYWMLVGNY
jgi:hypothetical protein